MPQGLYSEIGRLRKVMVCRPGLVQKCLTPTNCHELLKGVEADIDKDFCSALIATELQAGSLIIATDVDAVYLDLLWLPAQRAISQTTPQELSHHGFAAGLMAPKAEAAWIFLQATGQGAQGRV